MALFFPEWIPWWAQLTVIVIVAIFAICFLLMPFSVFGIKGRLNYLDNQMEDIQAQLRILLKRIPDARDRLEFKVQPTQHGVEEQQVYTPVPSRAQEKPASAVETSPRNRQTRFDPPEHVQSQPVRSYVQELTPPAAQQERAHVSQTRQEGSAFLDRDRRMIGGVKREEQLYDPPPQKEERQDSNMPRKRSEPILRWPPR